jgi:hypothetical protein
MNSLYCHLAPVGYRNLGDHYVKSFPSGQDDKSKKELTILSHSVRILDCGFIKKDPYRMTYDNHLTTYQYHPVVILVLSFRFRVHSS